MPVLINPYRFANPVVGGVTPPAVGTVTQFLDSTIAGGAREFTFSHDRTGVTGGRLLLAVALKGSTDVGPPTYTVNKVAYNAVDMSGGKIGENDLNLLAGQPTVIAYELNNPATGVNDVEFDITPSANDVQCIAMAAISIADSDGIGTGLDSDGSGGQATTVTSQSLSITTSAANSLGVGITAVRGANNAGTVTTPAGYTEHTDFTTGPSGTTDIVLAVHSIVVPSAGAQAYATSWDNAASFGSLAFEVLGDAP